MPLPPLPTLTDYALVGGGLQNALLALAIRHHQPDAQIVLVERAPRLGGNHTWCLHDGDVPPATMVWLEPLLAHRWPGYEVAFPDLRRRVALGYAAATSERLHTTVLAAVARGPGAVWLNAEAVDVGAQQVALADGRRLQAKVVVSALGPERAALPAGTGWQKFVGLELVTAAPHGLREPILMDARVPQDGGFRFVYTLPLDAHRLLVEDTCFADDPVLDVAAMRDAVLRYAATRGWQVARIAREERGVLPMPWSRPPPLDDNGPLLGGMQGGWFHPATGYSLAIGAQLAQCVASAPPEDARGQGLVRLREQHEAKAHFARKLNWALFRLAAPADRVAMMARFYQRPEDVIQRFYALDLHLSDQLRIVLGRPPRKMRWWPRNQGQETRT